VECFLSVAHSQAKNTQMLYIQHTSKAVSRTWTKDFDTESDGNGPVGRPMSRREDNTKVDLPKKRIGA